MQRPFLFLRAAVGLCFCFFWVEKGASQAPIFNEFMAANASTFGDEAGDFDDWAELLNAGSAAIDLSGWFLSDDSKNLKKHKIPTSDASKTTVAAGGFLVFWLDGEPSEGLLHTNFKLSASGEKLFLTRPDGLTVADSIVFSAQTADVSMGRDPAQPSVWAFFQPASPGQPNDFSSFFEPQVAPVFASKKGGLFHGPIAVSLTTATAGAAIRFTLDGSEPTDSSTLFTAPISIFEAKPLRARAFLAPKTPSPVLTETFLIGKSHAMPVVALTFPPAELFDSTTGIYSNFLENWEAPAHLELFEKGQPEAAVACPLAVEIAGVGSAVFPQKSLELAAKSAFGASKIDYPLWPDRPFSSYDRAVLRNSGLDWNVTMFRDHFISSLAADLAGASIGLQKPALETQAQRPVAAYLNGEFWGVYQLAERMNRFYVQQHFGLERDSFDFIENFGTVSSGSIDAWLAFESFLNERSFSSDSAFLLLKGQIDYQNWLDYTAFNIIIDNQDWPGNNQRRFRERKSGARWRWLSFDHDLAFGLMQYPGGWNTGDAGPNALARILTETPTHWVNDLWATLLFRKCWQNAAFRADFARRTADFLNVLFEPSRVAVRLGQFRAAYEPEMKGHFDRWSGGFWPPTWLENLQKMQAFAAARPDFMRQHVAAALEIDGSASLQIRCEPRDGGQIRLSTLETRVGQASWSGQFFKNLPLPAWAVAQPGFRFVGWAGASSEQNDSISLVLTENSELTALFEAIADPDPAGVCAAKSSVVTAAWLEEIGLGELKNASSKSRFSDFSALAATVEKSQIVPFSAKIGFGPTASGAVFLSVWADFDRDGAFSVLDEKLFRRVVVRTDPRATEMTVEGFLKMPATAPGGSVRLRILLAEKAFADPCAAFEKGEVEDYSLVFLDSLGGAFEAKRAEKAAFSIEKGLKAAFLAPVPASDVLQLFTFFEKGEPPETVEIFSIDGKMLARKTVSTAGEIGLAGLPSGPFFIEFLNEKGERERLRGAKF